MKTTILLFCLAFGMANFAFSQNDRLISPDWINKNFQPSPKIDFRKHLFLNTLDTLNQDSVEVHFPKEFLLEREWNSSNLQFLKPNESSLPYFELPPSQSRMPIISFDESVNYTILRKEFN